MWRAVAVILVSLAVCWFFCRYNNNHLSVSRYKLAVKEGRSFRIIHLSDLHGKQFGKGNRKLRKRIEELAPDLIAFTGDLIDDDMYNVPETVDFLSGLTELCPVVYIFGNHEHRCNMDEEIGGRLKAAGVYVLENSVADISIKGNRLAILGLDEGLATDKKLYRERKEGKFIYPDNSCYFDELSSHEGIKIVLSHFPENFDSKDGYKYKNYDFDFQLSGHAHGGQFRLPFIGGVFSPGQGINPRFYQGIHGSGPYMVVSRGLGNSRFPLRLFNCPEIVVVDVN